MARKAASPDVLWVLDQSEPKNNEYVYNCTHKHDFWSVNPAQQRQWLLVRTAGKQAEHVAAAFSASRQDLKGLTGQLPHQQGETLEMTAKSGRSQGR